MPRKEGTKPTKTQLINFINENYLLKGKPIPKSRLQKESYESLYNIVDTKKDWDKYKEWLNAPKLIKFMVEGIEKGKVQTWNAQYPSEDECRASFENDGIEVSRIEKASCHHWCKYCGGIAEGTDKDLLCDDCRELFGHTYYSEL